MKLRYWTLPTFPKKSTREEGPRGVTFPSLFFVPQRYFPRERKKCRGRNVTGTLYAASVGVLVLPEPLTIEEKGGESRSTRRLREPLAKGLQRHTQRQKGNADIGCRRMWLGAQVGRSHLEEGQLLVSKEWVLCPYRNPFRVLEPKSRTEG